MTDAQNNPVPTVIEFLLDETGSMKLHLETTIGGYNDFIDEQRRLNELCLLTLTKFDTKGLRTPYSDIDIQMVPYLNQTTFVPGEMTNLYDAIVTRIDDLKHRLTTKWDIKPKILFVVMTDGENNASRFNIIDVVGRVKRAIDEGWGCTYLGANQRANFVGGQMGFLDSNIKSFESARMRETMQELGRATKAFRAGTVSASNIFSNG